MNKNRNLAFGLVFALLIGLMVVPAFAVTTIEVPDDGYDSITEALAAAEPGDRIEVRSGYDSSDETFPILVQKDNVTIDGNGNLIEEGTGGADIGSKAIFAVGALWGYDDDDPTTYVPTTYRKKKVSGVTIRNFKIFEPNNGTGAFADVGFVLSNVSDVTIEDNVVDASDDDDTLVQGIRLIETVNSSVEDNVFVGMGDDSNGPNGIGIFLQGPGTTDNLIKNNGVFDSGLGAFLFEAEDNEIDGDVYAGNYYGGIVVNDSVQNLLRNLSVEGNAGWGVRFVHSDNNTLQESWIEKNGYGGVELIASSNNKIDSNVTYDNGTSNDVDRTAQIAVTKGEKGLRWIEQEELEVTPEEFVEEKEKLVAKMDLLEEWLHELNLELEQVAKDVQDGFEGDAMARLRTIIAQIDNNGDEDVADSDFGRISLPAQQYLDDTQTPSDAILQDTMMEDPTKNFTLEDAEQDFNYKGVLMKEDLDKYAGGQSSGGGTNVQDGPADWGDYDEQDDFGLNYSFTDYNYSWDKLSILHLITDAAKHEFYNDFGEETDGEEIDSLWEKIRYFYLQELIVGKDYNDLMGKIFGTGVEMEEGTLQQPLDDITGGAIGSLNTVDNKIFDGSVDSSEPNDIFDYVVSLYESIEDEGGVSTYEGVKTNFIDPINVLKDSIKDHVGIVRKDLNRIDLELPPFPKVETTLAEKKEKPFVAIGSKEFPFTTDFNISGLGSSVAPITTEFSTEFTDVEESENNEISSNVITTDQTANDYNAGVLLESPNNLVVNNTITNERVEPIDDSPAYGDEYHALDVGIYLLSNSNRLAYNAIEFIDTGIIRGGHWKRNDYQLEYEDEYYALVAYWPGPGFHVEDKHKEYDKGHFVERPISWIPVHTVSTGGNAPLSVGYTVNNPNKVMRNDIALNLFDQGGVGIDIVRAESNDIFANLFFKLENVDILFNATEYDYNVRSISVYENDHYGKEVTNTDNMTDSVHNLFGLNVDASADYTPDEGELGHTTVAGSVSPPAAANPQAYDNFGTSTKFDALNIGSYFPGSSADALLPPNLDEYLRNDVVLPSEKPRHPEDVFGPGTNGGDQGTCFSVSGLWNLVSMPVDPDNTDPSTVFDEVPGTLYLWEYDNGTDPWNTVEDGDLNSVDSLGGYYFWLPSDTNVNEICLAGDVLTGNQSIDMSDGGWQMFGVPYEVQWGDDGTIGLSDGTNNYNLVDAVNAGWVNNTIWEYNSSTQSFETATVSDNKTLEPDKGYWIFTEVDGLTMTFSETGGPGGPGSPPQPSAAAINLENVEKVESSPPVPVEPAGNFDVNALQVKAVSQTETVTFQVSGEGAGFVNGVKVEVFNAGGKRIKTLESGGNSVEWSTSGVANGVYLYAASVNEGGAYVQTNIDKLLLLK